MGLGERHATCPKFAPTEIEGPLTKRIDVEDLSPATAPGTVYDSFLERGTIAYQRCASCQGAVFPPRVLCPVLDCEGTTLTWEESTGRGEVHSITWLTPRDAPRYNVALIDLDEGFRMMTNVVEAESVAIGDRVRGRVDEKGDAMIPVFTLEESA